MIRLCFTAAGSPTWWRAGLLIMVLLVPTTSQATDIRRSDIPDSVQDAGALLRGHTAVATATFDEALFYNPAGLALYEARPFQRPVVFRIPSLDTGERPWLKQVVLASPMVEVSKEFAEIRSDALTGVTDPQELARDLIGQNLHVGANNVVALLGRGWGLGAFSSVRGDAAILKDPDFGGLETARLRLDSFAGVTLGGGIPVVPERVFIGTALRYLYHGQSRFAASAGSSIEQLQAQLEPGESLGYGQGIAGDLGVMARTGKIKYGAERYQFWTGINLRDLGGTKIEPEEQPAPDLDLKQTAHFGLAADIIHKSYFLRLSADLRDVANAYDLEFSQRWGGGAELWFNGAFGLRGGWRDGYPSYGLFLDLGLIKLDAGVYSEETGYTQGSRQDERYLARLTLGF